MKRTIYYLVMLLFALTMMGCSDDDKGIYFTEDEVQGDILTGNQVGIKDNTHNVYTTEESAVNVQGASGKISATSEDENIAKVIACDNTDEKRVHILGVSVGKTKITVTDEKGNSAQFIVNVDDVKNAWKAIAILVLDDKKCVVEGASKEDSAEIASEVITKDKKYRMDITSRGGFSVPRLTISDEQNNVLEGGILNWADDGQYKKFWVTPLESYSSVLLDQFYIDDKKGDYFVWDLTSVYREKYPSITSVKLYAHFSSLYFSGE